MYKSKISILAVALLLGIFFLVLPASATAIDNLNDPFNSLNNWTALTGANNSGGTLSGGQLNTSADGLTISTCGDRSITVDAAGNYSLLVDVTPTYYSTSDTNTGFTIRLTDGTNNYGFNWYGSHLLNFQDNAGNVNSTSYTFTLGTQYHINITKMGSIATLYINNVVIASISTSADSVNSMIQLNDWGSVPHTSITYFDNVVFTHYANKYIIVGHVSNAANSTSLSNVSINITSTSNSSLSYHSNLTDINGNYSIPFDDLSSGYYNLYASKTNFSSASIGFNVPSSFYNSTMVANFNLNPSTYRSYAGIYIFALNNNTGLVIPTANYTLWTNSSMNEIVWTKGGTQGVYNATTPGNYYLTITDINYTTFGGWIAPISAQDYAYFEYLSPLITPGPNVTTIDMYAIASDDTSKALSGAYIQLNYTNNTLAWSGFADTLGHIQAILPPGQYFYKITYTGYQTQYGAISPFGNIEYTYIEYLYPNYQPGNLYNINVTIFNAITANLISSSSTQLTYTEVSTGISKTLNVASGQIVLLLNSAEYYRIQCTSNGYFLYNDEIFTQSNNQPLLISLTPLPTTPLDYTLSAATIAPKVGNTDMIILTTPTGAPYDEIVWNCQNGGIQQADYKLINGQWNIWTLDDPNNLLGSGSWHPTTNPATMFALSITVEGKYSVNARVFQAGVMLANPSITVYAITGITYTAKLASFDAIEYLPLNDVTCTATDTNNGASTTYTLNNNVSAIVTTGDTYSFVFSKTGYNSYTWTGRMDGITYEVDGYLFTTIPATPTPGGSPSPYIPLNISGYNNIGVFPTISSNAERSADAWAGVDEFLNMGNVFGALILIALVFSFLGIMMGSTNKRGKK